MHMPYVFHFLSSWCLMRGYVNQCGSKVEQSGVINWPSFDDRSFFYIDIYFQTVYNKRDITGRICGGARNKTGKKSPLLHNVIIFPVLRIWRLKRWLSFYFYIFFRVICWWKWSSTLGFYLPFVYRIFAIITGTYLNEYLKCLFTYRAIISSNNEKIKITWILATAVLEPGLRR